jgi:signal transduction histidine kinase
MKQTVTELSQQYVTALRKHLQPVARAIPPGRAALRLGGAAVVLGLETLDLARIHEQALVLLGLPKNKTGLIKRASSFFTEANIPIEQTHRAAQHTKVRLRRMQETLSERTEELTATNRQLQRGVVRHKGMQDAAQKNGQHYKKCLEESLKLQKRLRQLTHRVLTAQEDDRKSISFALHDEIAQTLLGINVRLLALKQEARVNQKGLKKEIASTQRLVVKSVKSVRRVARELGDT